ncbi:hypothetical protein AMTR_s00059p00129260 [Amborella trichopoda]|uniref:G-patch domain-containing protein n=1 Tax=Amborella trichopoda TaxID=13333 RepID=U5D5S3_AMBTC|nr:hypothetical protein AMTR_s00059p00129260 [Amborella trichopoda]
MDKPGDPKLFVNDGSFMERFKQLQQAQLDKQGSASAESVKPPTFSGLPKNNMTNIVMSKKVDTGSNDARRPILNSQNPGGKLAFSLKQKPKLVVASKLGVDDEDDDETGHSDGSSKKPKLDNSIASSMSLDRGEFVPSPPSDPEVKKVADKLASFVAKNGRHLENVTRQRNPGDTPFKFLFDVDCADYKYYEYRIVEEEKELAQTKASQATSAPSSSSSGGFRPANTPPKISSYQHTRYQTPASALYCGDDEPSSVGRTPSHGESSDQSQTADPIAMMEYYAKKAAQEERKRPPKQSKDEMPPPPSLQAPGKKGHHMGDYIPQEELEKFLSACNDAAAQKAAKEAAEKAKIQADNVGHRLLSKMGWREGEGLGSHKSGRADPVMAGNVKLNNLGVGAEQPGEVTPEDDIYEQYKKRMMLGYRYRPNPLVSGSFI